MAAGSSSSSSSILFALFVAAQDGADHPAGPRRRRRAPRPLQPHAHARAGDRRAVRRPRAAAHRPARAGRRPSSRSRVITEDNVARRRSTPSCTSRSPTRSRSTYEVANPLQAIEQLTVTTLRNVIGGLTLEETLTSRDAINAAAADRARRGDGQVGHPHQPRRDQVDRPARVDPGGDGEADARRARPPRRDPHRRGRQAVRRSSPPRARSSPRCCAPRATRRRRSCAPRARRKAIDTVFRAIHEGEPDQGLLLSYQYLQMLPQLAQGEANKIFVIPSEFTQALGGLGNALGSARRAERRRRPTRPTAAGASRPAGPQPGQLRARADRRAATSPPTSGISARTRVPCPGGLATSRLPLSAPTRSASPRSPDPRSASAPPMPSSTTSTTSRPTSGPHADGRRRRPSRTCRCS